jgi:lipoprotein NlpD
MRPGKFTLFLLVILLLTACVSVNEPVRITGGTGAGWYTVKPTDTLYSIAWRYGLDYKQLAGWNKIDYKAPIYPGQRLQLVAPSGHSQAQNTSEQKQAAQTNKSSNKKTESSKTGIDEFNYRDPLKWIWPTQGKTLNTFSSTILDRRGIDIAGKTGQPVLAVANGKVVYSGNGLAGYGNLIIIKHSETFLSAYAYCQERLVEEGAAVVTGKVIAKMGKKDNTAKLHFEIRRNGKPVDPIKYLPKK